MNIRWDVAIRAEAFADNERTLVVSNWGGRLPGPADRTAKSQDLDIVVDDRGAPGIGNDQPHRSRQRSDAACRRGDSSDVPRRRWGSGVRRQRDERLDQRSRPVLRNGGPDHSACDGGPARAGRNAQCAGAKREHTLCRRRRRQCPGGDRPDRRAVCADFDTPAIFQRPWL